MTPSLGWKGTTTSRLFARRGGRGRRAFRGHMPKIPVSRVMFLISFALDPANWSSSGFDFDEEGPFSRRSFPASCASSRGLCAEAVLEGYRPKRRPS